MKLDTNQEQIVNSTAKNIIVSAGAGSGKTRVLTERVKHLIDIGVSPENIVCITFTNKAADEMRSRLKDVSDIGDAFIGTIHSFANRILKASGKKYDLLTAEKEIEIVRYLISKYASYVTQDDYMNYLDLRHLIKLGAKDESVLSAEFTPSIMYELSIFYGNHPKSYDIKNYPENLYTVCKCRGIITFDELLIECTKYFKSINAKIEYLLVDELQDIGMNEYSFIMALNADNNFFVGDDWQSIYRFKGGDVRIFLNLMQNPDWTSYYLSANYRNATNIMDIAKTVIVQADDIMDKNVYPIRTEGGEVIVDTKNKFKTYLCQIKKDGNYKDWFILVRVNKDIYEISKQLEECNIPYVTFKQGGISNEELDALMNEDTVKILTVHTSKGLENKNVILYGNFPIKQKPYCRNSDERKVMYVGITRAMDKVIILN